MDGQQLIPAGRGAARALLLAFGTDALAVAERVRALAGEWLGDRAAFPVLAPGAGRCDGLAEALDAVSAPSLAAGFARSGPESWRSPVLDAWFIADAHAPAAGEIETLLRILSDEAWTRLRSAIVPHGLVLAAPEDAGPAASWAGALRRAGAAEVLLAGPVDARRIRCAPEVWRETAALAVAACALGALPSPGACAGETLAVGAACWPDIGPEMREIAARLLAAGVLAELAGGAPALPAPAWPAGGPAQFRQEAAAVVPPPAPAWRILRTGPSGLADLPAALAREHDAEAAGCRAAQYALRGDWLAGAAAAWQGSLVERRAAHLSPAASRPRPAAWLELLQDARRRAQDWASQVEEWLEPVSGDYSRAEAETAAWNERLAALCAPFPAAGDEAAWLRLVLAPWRWPRLGWAAAVAIPAAVEELRRAQARLLRARSDEANLHAVRQLVLVMAQDLADAAGEAAALWGDVLQAAEALAGCPEPPAPWRLPAVRELAAGLAPRSGPDLAVLSAAAPGEPPEVAWLAWAHTRLGPVAGWDAAAWLAEACSDRELAAWVAARLAEARPLWPVERPADPDAAAPWLLLPLGASPACAARLDAAAGALTPAGGVQLRPLAGGWAGRTLLLVRWIAAELHDREMEVHHEDSQRVAVAARALGAHGGEVGPGPVHGSGRAWRYT
jgi:hypothetical protein